MFYFIANLIDPIVAIVGLLIGALNSTWLKRTAGVIFAAVIMSLFIAGIDSAAMSMISGISRAFALLTWTAVGAAIRGWRQRVRERAAE